MSASHYSMSMSSGKNCESFLELFRGDNGVPVTTQCFWRDTFFNVDDPASVCPVMKDVGHGVVVNFALAIGFHFDERTATPIVMTASVKFLSNFFESEFISQQQVPRQPPDFATFRILLDVMTFLGI
ncbi:MAG: hypothetical protein JNJ61_19390 [Anaerolineae bacterium]|nr:hypothetical protein [Anaerolineae bacterium]